MLYKTKGIVFRFTKYSETSIIVTIFTSLFGLQSYLVNGVRSKSSRNTIALYQPLTLLDLVVYHRENVNILRIKEIKCLYPYKTLNRDIRKSAIAMFLIEILNKAVKEQSHADTIGDFLIHSFVTLDQLQTAENFHLVFMIKLSRLLGFGPQVPNEILDGFAISQAEDAALRFLLTCEYEQPLVISYPVRKNLLDCLLRFYARHIENLGEVRSTEILKEVFN